MGRPAQRVEYLARVDHGLQPWTAPSRALHGKKQRQQTILVGRACIFAQSLTQRKMLGPGVRREPGGIGRKESKWRIFIFAVLGKIEMHATDKIPRGVAAFQEILNSAFRFAQLTPESTVHFSPQGLK